MCLCACVTAFVGVYLLVCLSVFECFVCMCACFLCMCLCMFECECASVCMSVRESESEREREFVFACLQDNCLGVTSEEFLRLYQDLSFLFGRSDQH